MLSGVTLRDSATIYIDPETTIGNDTVIEPFSFLIGKTSVGSNCVIGPFARIKDSVIGEGTKVSNSVIQESKIGRFNSIGPTSFIRPGTVTGDNVKIGACCEIKKSVIADGAKVPHLSYIGDAEIGKDVNVGAATVTCNYDGFHKNKTVIEDGVFIGSDTMLVAPVRVGKGSITAAGSVISEDVPPDSLAIERTKQVNIKEWAKKFREKKEREDSR
jgi:bifunctional UDP-N-acetylglucosamine pyrophosphorylase/glucosamine-1-phosphate N-acetyltransferase